MKDQDRSTLGMILEIKTKFNEFGINLKKCYGQGHDGASVMSSVNSGVQKQIKEIQSNAFCYNINLVVNDTVSGCLDREIFLLFHKNCIPV